MNMKLKLRTSCQEKNIIRSEYMNNTSSFTSQTNI